MPNQDYKFASLPARGPPMQAEIPVNGNMSPKELVNLSSPMSSTSKMERREEIPAAYEIVKLKGTIQITRNMQQDTLPIDIPNKQPYRAIIS